MMFPVAVLISPAACYNDRIRTDNERLLFRSRQADRVAGRIDEIGG